MLGQEVKRREREMLIVDVSAELGPKHTHGICCLEGHVLEVSVWVVVIAILLMTVDGRGQCGIQPVVHSIATKIITHPRCVGLQHFDCGGGTDLFSLVLANEFNGVALPHGMGVAYLCSSSHEPQTLGPMHLVEPFRCGA